MPPPDIVPRKNGRLYKNDRSRHCVLSTDFGQMFNPPPTEGFHMMLATMLQFSNLSENELKIMVKINPAKILGLT